MSKKSDNIKIVKEGKCIIPGDKFDKIKAVSPYVIRQNNNYIMYYVGTSCDLLA